MHPTHAWARQIGAIAAQSMLVSQATHTPWVVSHVGSEAMHCEELVAEHCVHSPLRGPLVWHAGVGTEQSLSAEHGPHA